MQMVPAGVLLLKATPMAAAPAFMASASERAGARTGISNERGARVPERKERSAEHSAGFVFMRKADSESNSARIR